jgi:hypothetical protein
MFGAVVGQRDLNAQSNKSPIPLQASPTRTGYLRAKSNRRASLAFLLLQFCKAEEISKAENGRPRSSSKDTNYFLQKWID